MGALTFYRYEQPIVDYCQAHQPLRLNMGYEGPPQGLEGLEDLGPCDRGTIQTVALPAVPSAASMGAPVPGPRSPPPPLRPPTEGPSSGSFLPAERTGTLKFGRYPLSLASVDCRCACRTPEETTGIINEEGSGARLHAPVPARLKR
ncbi:hypothetical protein PAMA_008020 [Pampus argenteus]